MLTLRFRFLRDSNRHFFDHLILGEQDIRESKADWVLKGLAIAQISWLILNVIVRSFLHLPVTQLEVATISFAAMAILSYMVNWWKPKDVSRATCLPLPTWGTTPRSRGVHSRPENDQPAAYAQSFISRLRSPTETRKEAEKLNDKLLRVPNDLVWMKGEGPLLFILMAFSSIGFGGLHCLARNFDFPSTAELLCWRVASIVSAALPTITLIISLVLHVLATDYSDFHLASMLLHKLKPMDELDPKFWGYIENPHWKHRGWDAQRFLARNPTGSRNWDEEPSAGIIEKYRNSKSERLSPRYFQRNLVGFSKTWQQARLEAPYAARLLCKKWFYYGDAMQSTPAVQVDFWQGYENYIRTKFGIRDPEISDRGWIDYILRAYKEMDEENLKLRGLLDKASSIITIVSGLVYTVARLTILILLFTCLRETPVDVYRVTPWVNFLPNIS
ncbi:hypothetical protein CNYM01_08946 [Colletotrichum nymphaeae SA-01]|uniref:Uncharacterized protein n=1 Tax=Colletotrichum nymphaeae SA-01 TaxID=1460502 RepID=A0A135TJP5_9PEZI|nr:hypothetical protein CNYM01_08946 [Colletotrichum nymphaeae SA-01]